MARFVILTGLSLFFTSTSLLSAATSAPHVPEEYVSLGEQSTGLAGGGSLSSSGYSAVRANPAMLAGEKVYTLGGGYHWPADGRDYYQAGVVDSKTSSVALGLAYTSSLDAYQGDWDKDGKVLTGETPVKRRINIGAGQAFKNFSLGISGGYVEAANPATTFDAEADRVKGFTLGAGAVVGILPNLRFGMSAENLANQKVAFAAPTIYRAGLVWGAVQDFSIYLDFRSREAVPAYDAAAPSLTLFSTAEQKKSDLASEKAVMIGGLAKIYDMVRVSLAAGTAIQGTTQANTGAGGIAIVNKSFVLAYGAQRPDLREAAIHHAVSLGLDIAM